MGDIFFRCKTRGGGKNVRTRKTKGKQHCYGLSSRSRRRGRVGTTKIFLERHFLPAFFFYLQLSVVRTPPPPQCQYLPSFFSVCGRELGMSADAASVAGANIGRSRPLHLALKTEGKNRDFLHLGNANMHALLVWRREKGGRERGEWEKPPRNGVKYIT